MKTLEYNYFTTALALKNFVNEHKMKPEDIQKISIPSINTYYLFYWKEAKN